MDKYLYIPYVKFIEIYTNMYHLTITHHNICNTRQYIQIHANTYHMYNQTNTYQYMPILTITYKTYQYRLTHNTCQYTSIHMNTDKYLSILEIHTICSRHTNTSQCRPLQYIQYIPYAQSVQIHTNTHQYLHRSSAGTYQYIPTLAIHNNNNKYQYIPQYMPCRYMLIHTTIQITIHTNKYHKIQYLPIQTLNFTDELNLRPSTQKRFCTTRNPNFS